MSLATATTPHLFWITSRAAGAAALLLSSASASLGLMMGMRVLKRRVPDARALHEALSLATLGALTVHAVALLGDGYLHPGIADIAVPFVSAQHRGWMSAGIVGGWLMMALGLSYYARGRIGAARWRRLHRFTALAWVLGLVHTLGQGTDSGQLWFLGCVALAVVPTAALLAVRLVPARPLDRKEVAFR